MTATASKVLDKADWLHRIRGARSAFSIRVATVTDGEIRGFVKNGTGAEYSVLLLANGQSFCSCKDAMYRRTVCKHAVAVSLTLLH